MLPLKVLKKQAAFDLIAACVKRSKEIQHASGPMIQASCLEHDHPTGPINAVTSYWRHRFETEGVPEPLESIEHIIAHVIGSNKQVRVIAIDTNEIACELTLHNAQVLKLDDRITILHATLEDDGKIVTSRNLSNDEGIDFLEESFDFIVSNPPCTPTNEIPKLQKEFEDVQAGNGGKDGLKVIRPLLSYASEKLREDGVLLLEILPSQPEKVRNLIEEKYSQKLKLDHIYEDCSSDERILEITKISELETTQAN